MKFVIATLVAIVVFLLASWGLGYTEAPAQGFLAFIFGVLAGIVTYYHTKDRY